MLPSNRRAKQRINKINFPAQSPFGTTTRRSLHSPSVQKCLPLSPFFMITHQSILSLAPVRRVSILGLLRRLLGALDQHQRGMMAHSFSPQSSTSILILTLLCKPPSMIHSGFCLFNFQSIWKPQPKIDESEDQRQSEVDKDRAIVPTDMCSVRCWRHVILLHRHKRNGCHDWLDHSCSGMCS